MSVRKSIRLILVAIIMVLVLSSFYAYPAENATITGDGVRVRDIPSVWSAHISSVLDKGARVELVAKTEFIDTIDGRSAPWYDIRATGWVFGGFVAVDEGISIPLVSFTSEDRLLKTVFVLNGYNAFGVRKSEIKKNLGKPLSEITKKGTCAESYGMEYSYYTLVYKDVIFRGWNWNEGDDLYSVTYTTDAYDFYGLEVGCSVADVERVLGPGNRYTYADGVDGLSYSGEKYEFVGWNGVDFKLRDEKITAIEFSFGEETCEESW
jgi:hypothetical protein